MSYSWETIKWIRHGDVMFQLNEVSHAAQDGNNLVVHFKNGKSVHIPGMHISELWEMVGDKV